MCILTIWRPSRPAYRRPCIATAASRQHGPQMPITTPRHKSWTYICQSHCADMMIMFWCLHRTNIISESREWQRMCAMERCLQRQ